VADCILSKEDSRRRAAVIKHFINVADVSSTAINYSYGSNLLPRDASPCATSIRWLRFWLASVNLLFVD
jgi:hypothetical protein